MIKVPGWALPAILLALLITGVLYAGGFMMLQSYVTGTLYPAYSASLALSPGDLGTAPGEGVPQAHSVDEMASFDPFYLEGKVYLDAPERIDGRLYYEVELENGENILARINQDQMEHIINREYRLPIGRWVPLTAEEAAQVDNPFLDVSDHYADMMGDFDQVMTEGEFFARHDYLRYLNIGAVALFLVLYIVFCVVFWRRKKRKLAARMGS